MPCEELQEVPECAPRNRRHVPYVDWSSHPRHLTFHFTSYGAASNFARFYEERDGERARFAFELPHWVVRFMRPL